MMTDTADRDYTSPDTPTATPPVIDEGADSRDAREYAEDDGDSETRGVPKEAKPAGRPDDEGKAPPREPRDAQHPPEVEFDPATGRAAEKNFGPALNPDTDTPGDLADRNDRDGAGEAEMKAGKPDQNARE